MQTTEQSKTLEKNYNAVKENIKKACEQAGRSQEEVTLLAVSKTKPVDMLMDVYQSKIYCGQGLPDPQCGQSQTGRGDQQGSCEETGRS